MKIAIVINGTRGDVQPMLALAIRLIQHGHEPLICAPPENETLVKKYNQMFIDVSKTTNQRLIISKGWADLPENNSIDMLYVDEISEKLQHTDGVALTLKLIEKELK